MPKYKILRKAVQCGPIYAMRTDGETDEDS